MSRLDWLAGEMLRLGVVDTPLRKPYPAGLTELLRDIDLEIAARNQLTLEGEGARVEMRVHHVPRGTRAPRDHKPTQGERILAYLRAHPRCTSLDLVRDLNILNHTARVHELRAIGHNIVVTRDPDRHDVFHYELREKRETSQF